MRKVRTGLQLLFWKFAVVFLAGVCIGATPNPGEIGDETDLEPAVGVRSPRPITQLVRILQMRSDVKGRGLVGWLTGKPDEPLFSRPYGVIWLGNDLIVTDPGSSVVKKIRDSKKPMSTKPGLFTRPIGIASCLGWIVVSDSESGRVALLDRDLELERWLAEDLQRPTGVACSEQGVVVVETGAHRIVVLAPEGGKRTLGQRGDAPGSFNFPTAVAPASTNEVWIGDTLNFRIQRIDLNTGEATVVFGTLGDAPGEMPRVKGIMSDRRGVLWVSDAQLNQIALFAADGGFLATLGAFGSDAGEFSFPVGMAQHENGQVAVVDSLNRRIQIFEPVQGRPE